MVNHSGNFTDVRAGWSGKVHRTSPCCPLSRPRLCKPGCLQVVQDLLTWLEASGCHFCLAVCQGCGFRKKSSAIVSCAYWRNVLWFSKGEGGLAAWDLRSACGLLTEPWLLAMLYTASVGGKRSRWWRDGDPCVSGEQMCEPSRLRWLSCCSGTVKPRLVSAYREFATICYLYITWLFGSEGEITFFFSLSCFWPKNSPAAMLFPPLSSS